MDATHLAVVICTSVASICGAIATIWTIRMRIENRRHEFDAVMERFREVPERPTAAEVTAFAKVALRDRKTEESGSVARKLGRLRSAS
jgi:hypothetical protein